MRVLLFALGLAAAVACVAAANLVLLGYGREKHDPVGRLNPVAPLSATAPVPPVVTEPDHEDGRDD